MKRLTLQRLRELLIYDPATGLFIWRVSRGRIAAGAVAGNINGHGYRQIRIDGLIYQAHRLAWLFVKGKWPTDKIDHKNGICDDNRFSNLREATHTQNMRNARTRRNSATGFKGVHLNKRVNRWRAYIHHDGRQRHLGYFDTPAEAHAAYCRAAIEVDPEFARTA